MNKEIKNCLLTYANAVATTVQYESWSDAFCRSELKITNQKIIDIVKDQLDWKHLEKSEALDLGFVRWDEDLYLIPLWLLPVLPIGTKLVCISGNEIVYNGENIDKDIRFGCLAYGIIIKEN